MNARSIPSTPGTSRITRSARESSGRRRFEPIVMSQLRSSQASRVICVTPAASAMIPSRLPTASATISTVEMLRRRRRPTLRNPI
jgi:hypothetical protein